MAAILKNGGHIGFSVVLKKIVKSMTKQFVLTDVILLKINKFKQYFGVLATNACFESRHLGNGSHLEL